MFDTSQANIDNTAAPYELNPFSFSLDSDIAYVHVLY